MELKEKQLAVLQAGLAGTNLFITGEAGSGKSTVVNILIEELCKAKKKVMALAPTGIAAANINGATLHSTFALDPYPILTFELCKYLKGAKREALKHADCYIIDEVSMVRPDIVDACHWTLKKNGLPGLDEKQVIFVGDMEQLEVVLDDNMRSVLLSQYDGATFDFAKIYRKINPQTIHLDEIVRQTDLEFIEALRMIRRKERHVPYFRQFIHQDANGVILAPHNATVKKYNEQGLTRQKGETFTFTAIVEGTAKPEDFRLEREINVKIGCPIMYMINSGANNPLRNGTTGIFTSHKDCHFIQLKGTDTPFALEPITLTKKQYVYNPAKDILELEEVGKITQMPIALAYAMSIHKSQGMTFDEITVDLSQQVFGKGMLYVALSRVRTPAGLRIIKR